MTEFTRNTSVKCAVRTLAEPIADIGAFSSLVQTVIMGNPFGCVAYMTTGAHHPPVEKIRETYTARIAYRDSKAKTVGVTAETYSTVAGFNAGIAAVLANTANAAAHTGTPARSPDADSYSATLRCHDPNGEIYYVNFSRRQVTLSSYEDESIRAKIKKWADSVPALV
jgi:predicted secreted protein